MFIKLTRLDNSPIWLNAGFIVTVEPRRGGGSIVVPIGDGLDYDVREKPEDVLALLGDAPAPVVVPVPAPEGLTKTPDDVSPEPVQPEPTEVEEQKPVKKRATRARAKAKVEEDGVGAPTDEGATKPPRKRATRKTRKPELVLTDEQVGRLCKMMPGSIRKLQNTLVTQFKVADVEAEVAALVAQEVISLDNDHVIWPNRESRAALSD